MKNQESLKSRALIGNTPDFIHTELNLLPANRVVATGVIVGCILFARDHLIWMEELAVSASANLICFRKENTFRVKTQKYISY